MQTVKEYKVVTHDVFATFNVAVNVEISKGFQPFGPVTAVVYGNKINYMQTMVKY